MKERIVLNLEIDKLRYKIQQLIESNFITEFDLINLMNENNNFGLQSLDNLCFYKQKILRNLYNSPFLLCDQENLSDNIKKLLPQFIKYRYDMEIEEVNLQFKKSLLSEEDYQSILELLNFVYYESSNDGKNILSTGFCIGINDRTLKFKK